MFRKNSAGDPVRALADLLTAKGAGDTPEPGAPVSADPVVQNGGDRLLALSFSSERPVLREYDFGPAWEVLGHDPQEVDLSRLNSGAAPLLKDHRRDVDSQIGVVVSAQITGGRGRAVVRFADTPDGSAMLARVTSTTAPALIGTHSMGDAFIDALRPQVRVLELGATRMSGLVENVSVPRMAAGTAAEWIAEDAAATESTPVFDAVSLTMKQLSANTRISRRQLKQSVPAVDAILSNDLRQQIAVALDRAAITGAGTANEPRGVLNVAGIGIRAMGANGAALTWDAVTAIVSMVEAANVDPTALGFLSNYKVKGRMMATPKVAGTDSMILSPDEAEPMLAGHRARFSGNVPDNLTKGTGTNLSALIFGNWSDLLVGQWGGIDLIVDDVTEAAKGNVKLVAHSEWDIAVRHAESFAAIKDIVAA